MKGRQDIFDAPFLIKWRKTVNFCGICMLIITE